MRQAPADGQGAVGRLRTQQCRRVQLRIRRVLTLYRVTFFFDLTYTLSAKYFMGGK